MITRRGFMISSGSALAALSLAGAALAAHAGDSLISIASPARPMAPALQGAKHLVLSGDRLADVRALEAALTGNAGATLRLSLDAADAVLFDVARTRVGVQATQISAAAGHADYRLISTGV